MSSINIFITPQELFDLIDQWRRHWSLDAAVFLSTPDPRLSVVGCSESVGSSWVLAEVAERRGMEVWLSSEPFSTEGTSHAELRALNPNVILLRLPTVKDKCIEESTLGVVGVNETLLEQWKEICKSIRRDLNQGLWIINRGMKVKHYYKSYYYTDEVANRIAEGWTLSTLTGLEASIQDVFI